MEKLTNLQALFKSMNLWNQRSKFGYIDFGN